MTGEGRKGDTAQWVQDKIPHSLPPQVSSVLSQQPVLDGLVLLHKEER